MKTSSLQRRLGAFILGVATLAAGGALSGCKEADAASEPKPCQLNLSTLALVTARGNEAEAAAAAEAAIEQIAHRDGLPPKADAMAAASKRNEAVKLE